MITRMRKLSVYFGLNSVHRLCNIFCKASRKPKSNEILGASEATHLIPYYHRKLLKVMRCPIGNDF